MKDKRISTLLAPQVWILESTQTKSGPAWFWHDNQGNIPTWGDFFLMVQRCQKFYDAYSDEQIEQMSREAKEENHARYPTSPAKGDKSDKGYVYLIKSTSGHYKIGKSKNPKRRLDELNRSFTIGPFDLSIIAYHKTNNMTEQEAYWHNMFADCQVNGEWFMLSNAQVEMFKDGPK